MHKSLITPPEVKAKAEEILALLEGLSFFEAGYSLDEAAVVLQHARARLSEQRFSLAPKAEAPAPCQANPNVSPMVDGPVTEELEDFVLPAATVCKRAGIPFALAAATMVRCSPSNWPSIRDGFVAAVGDQALASSQSEQKASHG